MIRPVISGGEHQHKVKGGIHLMENTSSDMVPDFETEELYAATLAIADRQMDRDDIQGAVLRPRLGTGGNFRDLFLWDTAFCVMWAKYHPERFAVENSLDNFYRLADENGFISRQYLPDGSPKWSADHPISFAPPLLAWVELDLHRQGWYPERLARVYPFLKRHHEFCVRRYRHTNGMFFSDPYGCGLDTLPRWPRHGIDPRGGIRLRREHIHPEFQKSSGDILLPDRRFSWNRQANWIDTSAQMALDSEVLAQIGAIIDRPADEIRAFREEHASIAAAINAIAWSEKDAFYFDTLQDGTFIRRFHATSYWTLAAGVVPEERLDRYIAHLTDPRKFRRPVPVPTIAADDLDYNPENGYSTGSVWPFMNYMILRGLQRYHRTALAQQIAQKSYDAVKTLYEKTGTIWETYSPEQQDRPSRGQPDFCGWSALIPIAVRREFLR